jgi:hypothetical protein
MANYQCCPGSGRGFIYGMSNPKALGPTTFIASCVFSIGLAGSTNTPTLIPYRMASVVIGSPTRKYYYSHHASINMGGGGVAHSDIVK